MASDITAIYNFLISIFSQIGTLYLTSGILAAVLGLVVLRKLVNIIRQIMP